MYNEILFIFIVILFHQTVMRTTFKIQGGIDMVKIMTVLGDITKVQCDIIVNAANTSLLGGGGVDGAIHQAAGPELLEECRKLNGCETGKAKITKGYNLPCDYVIHTPGPIWHGGKNHEEELLISCYQSCLELALENHCTSIAFPSISTGVYQFPLDRAAKIAIGTILKFCKKNSFISKVQMVCFDEKTKRYYDQEIKKQV